MNDWLIGAICVAVLLFAVAVGDAIRITGVVNDCQKMQSFRYGDKVYDCKERSKP
jgi:hypothetical protein